MKRITYINSGIILVLFTSCVGHVILIHLIHTDIKVAGYRFCVRTYRIF